MGDTLGRKGGQKGQITDRLRARKKVWLGTGIFPWILIFDFQRFPPGWRESAAGRSTR